MNPLEIIGVVLLALLGVGIYKWILHSSWFSKTLVDLKETPADELDAQAAALERVERDADVKIKVAEQGLGKTKETLERLATKRGKKNTT